MQVLIVLHLDVVMSHSSPAQQSSFTEHDFSPTARHALSQTSDAKGHSSPMQQSESAMHDFPDATHFTQLVDGTSHTSPAQQSSFTEHGVAPAVTHALSQTSDAEGHSSPMQQSESAMHDFPDLMHLGELTRPPMEAEEHEHTAARCKKHKKKKGFRAVSVLQCAIFAARRRVHCATKQN